VLPLPTRPQFQPNFQSYELAKESAKRSIQAACGMYNSAVGKHDSAVKSGVQQKALDTQSAQGNFHFVDNYDRFLQHMGRVIDERIPVYYDTARQVGMRKSDDAHQMAVINNPQYQAEQGQTPLPTYDLTTGQHDVTVGVGPSFESQREAADAYLQQLVANLATLPFDPAIKSKMLALAIRMQQLGPLGDAMADLLDPKEMAELPPQAQQMLSKMQQQIQALNAYAQQVEAEKKKLEDEKAAKIVDNEYKVKMAEQDRIMKVAIAEIQTNQQVEFERLKWEHEAWKVTHNTAHDAGMQADSQAHQSSEAEAQRQAAAESQATQQGHEADMAAQAQAAQEQQGAQE
jgi:hypothetical protein